MRRALIPAAAALALALAGCQTAKVTLLNNEDNATVGAVAVLDPKTGQERGVVTTADTEAKTGSHKIKPRKSKAGGFAALFGGMPRPVFERELEFINDTTTVTPESQQALSELLALWQKDKAVSDIEIIGYADSTGTPGQNLELSQARADAIRKLLENQGFEFTPDNSEVVGRGDVDALAKNGPGVADPKYRKVTVQIR
jgi:outer membrane protein OmpA-like peptidoglycan-associated protein